MNETCRRAIQALHQKGSRSYWQSHLYIIVFFAIMAVSLWAWYAGYWPITVVCWGLMAHVGHMNLIAFHEASHYSLHRNRFLNEASGIIVGTISLTPLSVYRYVHNQHHLNLGTPRDIELWPFVNPGVSRSVRIVAAIGELVFGFFYTPIVFLHGVLVADRMPAWQMRRVKYEYALCAVAWTLALAAIAYFGVWEAFLVGYMVPSIIAGNLQSLRKFTEHMGLFGDTILTTTRSVVDERLIGIALSESMMHIDYHGIHHAFAKIPQYSLPSATPYVYGDEKAATAIYPTYMSAVWDMVKTLSDPRVGKQWLTAP